jgi:hypothetical protein
MVLTNLSRLAAFFLVVLLASVVYGVYSERERQQRERDANPLLRPHNVDVVL